MRRLCASGALLLLVTACEEEALPPPLPASAAPPTWSADTALRSRVRRYFVVNDEGVCAVYWEEAGERSVAKTIACPRELDGGERMRLAGRTCMRESSTPDRNVPVRCAKQLFYAEGDDQRGKGEFKLPSKK